MGATQNVSTLKGNHAFRDFVAIEQLGDQILSLALGARECTAAPRDKGVHQLRRDLQRGRNRSYHTILRIALADVEDGQRIENIVAPLYAAIHAIEQCAGNESGLAFEHYLKIEAGLRAKETKLEIDVLSGAGSSKHVSDLDITLAREENVIEQERRALHERMYRPDSAVA